jgi:DNA-binding IclR family transcriptional regulator
MRGLQILGLFSLNRRVLNVNDFAEGLGVTAPSIYRTVVTLTELGYLEKTGRNSYELGSMVLSRGFCYLASREIVEVASPHLIALRDETSSSCHLAVREGIEAVYLYQAQSHQRLVVHVPIGSRFVCHSVAVGRALLTGLNDEALSELFSGVALDGFPQSVPNALPQLRQMIADEREQGFSINRSDFSTAIAVPITNYAGEVVAAINVSAPDTVMGDSSVRESLTVCLKATATNISRELGGSQPKS